MRSLKTWMVLAALGVLFGCNSSYLSGGYSYSDAAPAVLALTAAIEQASTAPIPGVAYSSTISGGVMYTFVSYYSASGSYVTAPYTLTGSITETTVLNGAVGFTGGNVTRIAYNNVTSYPSASGTYTITFTGGLVYTYNLATGTFTLS